jgi:Dynamin central region/Dynamin family
MMDINQADGRTFSEDVLRLELVGPTQEHFSVIDVPGIFKRKEAGVTTKEDMALVDRMVREYMTNPRSVILAVVPCNGDVAMQEILERAEEVDPEGIRTLGVLTKPDLVDRGAEAAIVDMIEGNRQRLLLGWHILRNPGQADIFLTMSARLQFEENFFRTVTPWQQLDKEKVGITTLRQRLQAILADHIRREFPKVRMPCYKMIAHDVQVKSEINSKLQIAETDLHDLGPKRQTHLEFATYTTDLAVRFQELVAKAITANYSRSDLFQDEKLRLATKVVNRSDLFARLMRSHGHFYSFKTSDSMSTDLDNLKLNENKISTRTEDGLPEIEDLLVDPSTIESAKPSDILEWLEKIYSTSRGFEVGTFDAALLAVTMKQQAKKWADLALGYVSDIVTLVHTFVIRVMHHVAPDRSLAEGCLALITDRLRENYQNAIDHARFLLSVELAGTPATHDPTFHESLQARYANHHSREFI